MSGVAGKPIFYLTYPQIVEAVTPQLPVVMKIVLHRK